jgi:hypothetical protein
MKLQTTTQRYSKIKTARVRTIVDAAIAVLTEYDAAGFAVTLRQLFYRLVADGVLLNCVPDYRNLGRYINQAKEAGTIDWDWVEDRTRMLRGRQRYHSTADLLAAAATDWHMDYWVGQPTRPEVWIEKDALLSIVAPVCNVLDVRYYSLRGWGRPSDKFDAARRFSEYAKIGQSSVVLHAGDYDPTGCSATTNIETELSRYAQKLECENFVVVSRIALNKNQIENMNIPPNKIGEEEKSGESRWNGFVRENNGNSDTWELDALRPAVLQDIVRRAIESSRTNMPAWEKQQRLIRSGSKKLAKIIEAA